jgi:hypothetical protein
MDAVLTRAITVIAAAQHGLITADQLRQIGVTPSQLRTLVARGRLRAEAPRVYVVAGAPASLERTQLGGLMCLGPTAVLSHEAAARLHSFDRCLPDVVEFSMPRSGRGRKTPYRVHTTGVFGPHDRVMVGGFACTSATRTVIDLARARVPTVRLEAAIDSAVRAGASAPIVIARRLAEVRGPGRWGAPRIDELLLDSGGHTPLERRFLQLMRRAGLPRPLTQVVYRHDGRTFARVDFLFEAHDIVVEVSGRMGHSSAAERARDAQRRNELQDSGLRVYEFTFDEVMHEATRVARTMRARLGLVSGSAVPVADRLTKAGQ